MLAARGTTTTMETREIDLKIDMVIIYHIICSDSTAEWRAHSSSPTSSVYEAASESLDSTSVATGPRF